MAVRSFLRLTAVQAGRWAEATAGSQNRLEPRHVKAGAYRDSYVLPLAVLFDPAHADKRGELLMLTEIAFDIDEAWPIEEPA